MGLGSGAGVLSVWFWRVSFSGVLHFFCVFACGQEDILFWWRNILCTGTVQGFLGLQARFRGWS